MPFGAKGAGGMSLIVSFAPGASCGVTELIHNIVLKDQTDSRNPSIIDSDCMVMSRFCE